MLWDTGRPYHYARWTPDSRLLFGGRDRPHVPRTTPARRAAREARATSGDDLVRALSGARRHATRLRVGRACSRRRPTACPTSAAHRRYPRHLFALGYGGNGMTFGFFACAGRW